MKEHGLVYLRPRLIVVGSDGKKSKGLTSSQLSSDIISLDLLPFPPAHEAMCTRNFDLE